MHQIPVGTSPRGTARQRIPINVSGFVAQGVKIPRKCKSRAACLDSDVYSHCSFFRFKNNKNSFRRVSRGRAGCEEPRESRQVRALPGSRTSQISSKERGQKYTTFSLNFAMKEVIKLTID